MSLTACWNGTYRLACSWFHTSKEIVVEPETSLTDMLYPSSFQGSIIVVGMIKFPN